MANNDIDNPLLKALPPVVDYVSYLTILEYNLTAKQLPVLHHVLQDAELTVNIGWDLVHLLLPLLPESQSCLQDVAHLGNPREVVLKVTELLEALAIPEGDEEEEEETDGEGREAQEYLDQPQDDETQSGGNTTTTAPASHPDASAAILVQNDDLNVRVKPSKVSQFSALLDMLAILHPRIKTKYPSRFLSTSLQAILPVYTTLVTDSNATEAVLDFIKTFAGGKRPRLPPRKSSTQILTQATRLPTSAPDPEGNTEPLGPEETALQKRLLQSFLTFVAEGYVFALPADDDIPALSWSSRLLEHLHPEKKLPGRRTIREAFEKDEGLHHRDSTIGKMLALTRDLDIPTKVIYSAIFEPETSPNQDSNELPSSASDVPLSRPGCLYLLSASYASRILFHSSSDKTDYLTESTFFSLLSDFLGPPSSATLGTEPSSLIDSILFFGHYTSEKIAMKHSLKQSENESTWTETLQYLSILSANTPSASLRYNAHVLTSKLLHAHSNDQLRLSFIKDTLEHCPYENLKASAVGWLKDEILAADMPLPNQVHGQVPADGGNEKSDSIFATPTCIATLAPQLFVSPLDMSTEEFLAHESFFLAALNLYFLLLSKDGLSAKLDLRTAMDEVVVSGKRDCRWLLGMERRLAELGEENEGGTRVQEIGGSGLMEGVIAMCREKEREMAW
ncbi:MAG: hypothetical protein Q9182_003431 [Xanthomendoza sp. 2 TL-2023]